MYPTKYFTCPADLSTALNRQLYGDDTDRLIQLTQVARVPPWWCLHAGGRKSFLKENLIEPSDLPNFKLNTLEWPSQLLTELHDILEDLVLPVNVFGGSVTEHRLTSLTSVQEAILKCWSESSTVVVQTWIGATCSGTATTTKPVEVYKYEGRRMSGQSYRGEVERLLICPDNFEILEESRTRQRLTSIDLTELIDTAAYVGHRFDQPQVIDWVYRQGCLWYLRAKPLKKQTRTSLPQLQKHTTR